MISYLITFLFSAILITGCEPGIAYEPVSSPTVLTPTIPVDVDPEIRAQLIKEDKIYELNERYNLYSWQAFVAINWPMDNKGEPLPNFNDAGDPTWLNWKEAFQVYRKDGKAPANWGAPRTESGLKMDNSILSNGKNRIILQTKTPTHPGNINIADEKDQAFAGELFDQNGNLVVYEVLMNKEEFDYIVDNKLYNQNGQIDFYKKNGNANFPKGNYEKNQLGAVEIKFAWKQLTKDDIPERYFISKGCIWDEETSTCSKPIDLGMIGMHISQKTPSGKQWVWSTFEHVDNLVEKTVEYKGKDIRIKPSLYDPDCEICPVNVDYTSSNNSTQYMKSEHGNYFEVTTTDNKGKVVGTAKYFAEQEVIKTQAKRMIDIPPRVKYINNLMQQYFAQEGSIWQYYMLIDTQYPLDQNAAPGNHTQAGYKLPSSVTNKPGGNPNISFLTNMTMETFFQSGNQSAGNLIEGEVTSDINIFGTESCMGCHSSAGIYTGIDSKGKGVSGDQLTGDFSWLLGRANWEEGVIKPKQ